MVRVIHPHISRWFAAVAKHLEISTVAPFKNIDLWIMDFGIYVII